MRELGIDLADRHPKLLTRELAEEADVVVTMGCGDRCPYIPGKRYRDWQLPDHKGRPLGRTRPASGSSARIRGGCAAKSGEGGIRTLNGRNHPYRFARPACTG